MGDGSGVDTDVLVVGAGPVGLTLACELYRHGGSCRLIDKDAGLPGESRAIAVQSRTLEIFEGMGIVEQVLEQGRIIHQANFNNGRRKIAQLVFDELDSSYPYLLILPQNRLEEILLQRLSRYGGKVEWRKKFKSLTEDQQRVSITLSGAQGAETLRASWLVGCDGMGSAVGAALSIPYKETKRDGVFLLLDVQMQSDLPDDEIHQFFFQDGSLAVFPLPEKDLWRLIVESDEELPSMPSMGFIQSLLQQVGVAGTLRDDPVWSALYPLHYRLARRFQAGRCFLAGDAAHTYSPVGGQGMNMGIQDAHNLAWKLGLVLQQRAWEWLLKSYQDERCPLAAATLRGTKRATRVVMLRQSVSRQVQNRVAALLGSFDVVQQRLARRLAELDLSYSESSIVEECHMPLLGSCFHLADKLIPTTATCLEFGSTPQAGERVPDVGYAGAEGGDRSRLFALLQGTRHRLFLFSGLSPKADQTALFDVASLVNSSYGRIIKLYLVVHPDSQTDFSSWQHELIQDADGALHRHFGLSFGGMYLIRPDGYIGFRSQPVLKSVFADYLKRTFIAAKSR